MERQSGRFSDPAPDGHYRLNNGGIKAFTPFRRLRSGRHSLPAVALAGPAKNFRERTGEDSLDGIEPPMSIRYTEHVTQSVIAQTDVVDSPQAGKLLGRQMSKAFAGEPPDAVILFASAIYDYPVLMKELMTE